MEKRTTQDRRKKPTPPISKYMFVGRRKKARRAEEDQNYYVDRYALPYFIVVAIILVFCFLDTYFTQKILINGGTELNFIWSKFVMKNFTLTRTIKYIITFGWLIFLLIHKNFKLFGTFKTKFLIYAVLTIYLLLVGYEFYFYFRIITI